MENTPGDRKSGRQSNPDFEVSFILQNFNPWTKLKFTLSHPTFIDHFGPRGTIQLSTDKTCFNDL